MSDSTGEEVCRICRGEGSEEEPLFFPCQCTGTIKYVHQDCLLTWVEHTQDRRRCDICGSDYSLRKRYREGSANLKMKDTGKYIVAQSLRYVNLLLLVFRFVASTSVILIVMGYSVDFIATYLDFYLITQGSRNVLQMTVDSVRKAASQDPPRQSVAGPFVDAIFSNFVPWSFTYVLYINGLVLLIASVVVLLFLYCIVTLFITDDGIRHDLRHIERGDRSHMDYDGEEYLERITYEDPPAFDNSNRVNQRDHVPPREFEDWELNPPREDDFDDQEDEQLLKVIFKLLVDAVNLPIAQFLSFLAILTVGESFVVGIFCVLYGTRVVTYVEIARLISRIMSVESVTFIPKPPKTIPGYIGVTLFAEFMFFSIIRTIILINMPSLLSSVRGRKLIQLGYIFNAAQKTFMMTIIEIMAFPTLCGALIQIATLPLTPSVSWHLEMLKSHRYAVISIQWVLGFLYMHSLQIFAAVSRRIFRPGVLYFLHKTDTTYFMRSMVLVPLGRQLRRIVMSLGIYCTFILVGVLSTSIIFRFLVPLLWPLKLTSTISIDVVGRLWPCMVLYALYFAKLVGGTSLRDVLTLYTSDRLWVAVLYKASVALDLGSWLFNHNRVLSSTESEALENNKTHLGYFVRAPVDVPEFFVRMKGHIFVPVDASDRRLDGKTGVDPDFEVQIYCIVWRPKNFRYRVALLFVALWTVASLLLLPVTVGAIALGRFLNATVFGSVTENDIVLWLVGLSVVLPVMGYFVNQSRGPELIRTARFWHNRGEIPWPTTADFVDYRQAVAVLIYATMGSKWFALPSANAAFNCIAFYILSVCFYRFRGEHLVVWLASIDRLIALFGGPANPTFGNVVYICIGAISLYYIYTTLQSNDLKDKIRDECYFEGYEVVNYEKN